MNPHTPHPDEGRNPRQPAGQPNRRDPPRAAPPADDRGGRQSSGPCRHLPAAPADTSATLRWTFRPGHRRRVRRRPPPPPPPYYGPTPPPAGSQPQKFFDWIRSQGIHRGRERWVGRRCQRHRPPARRRPADCPRHPHRPDSLRGRRRPPLRHRLGAPARTRRPDPRPGGRRGPLVRRDDRRADHHDHRLPQPGHRQSGAGTATASAPSSGPSSGWAASSTSSTT